MKCYNDTEHLEGRSQDIECPIYKNYTLQKW